MKPPYVTDHACLRWLERHEGMDVDGFRRDLAAIEDIQPEKVTDCALLEWVLTYRGLQRDDVVATLTPPLVRRAWRAGAKRCGLENLTLVFENDFIVTVVEGRYARKRRTVHRGTGRRRKSNRNQWLEDSL